MGRLLTDMDLVSSRWRNTITHRVCVTFVMDDLIGQVIHGGIGDRVVCCLVILRGWMVVVVDHLG